MTDLIPPHGGLTEPVCCTVPEGEIAAFKAEAASLPTVPVSAADLSSVYRFADGTLSPLTGPMDSEAYQRVLDEQVIIHHGNKYAWTIPLSFPVTAAQAKELKEGTTIALTNPGGDVVATLKVSDVFPWDKCDYLKKVYRTGRLDHPGADMVIKQDADKTHLIGGEIRALPQPKNAAFGQYVLTPREVRKVIAEARWDAVVAFQTRNPLHRAHEYALVYGLESLLKAGKNAGAVLNPLIGETKGDDVNAEIRMQTYEKLITSRQMGDGDVSRSLWDGRR
ncbi:MAG: hypothetical protein R3C02_21450 [Planctomycetaceae bacterium]